MNDEQTKNGSNQQTDSEKPRVKKRQIVPLLVILLIGLGIFIYWFVSRGKVSTDDAQVDGDLVPISARVSGYVKAISVSDNQLVQPGELLVQLDQRDLSAKLNTQEADLATQKAQAAAAAGQKSLVEKTAPSGVQQAAATVIQAQAGVQAAQEQIGTSQDQYQAALAAVTAAQEGIVSAKADVETANAQVQSAQAVIKSAQANVVSAQAQAQRAASDAARYQDLFNRGAASRQALEAAQATNTSAQETLNSAREQVNTAQASLAQAQARKSSAIAAVKQATARLASAKATASQAQKGISLAQTALKNSQGRLNQAIAAESGANTVGQQLSVAEAQRSAAIAKAAQSQANVENAQLQLSYTTIVSPVQGFVSQKNVQIGQYVTPGQQLMSIVPLNRVWVTANFKETQLTNVRPGMRATVEVDTYPGKDLEGIVQSIGAATGAKFSLLPPQNATGNFVKVVQRIPVKITFDKPLPKGVVLRPGQSVTATIFLNGGK